MVYCGIHSMRKSARSPHPRHTYVTFRYLTLAYVTLRDLTLPYVTLRYLALPYVTLRYLTLPYATVLWVNLRRKPAPLWLRGVQVSPQIRKINVSMTKIHFDILEGTSSPFHPLERGKSVARTGQCADRPVLAQFSPRFSPSSRHIFAREVPKVNKLSKKLIIFEFL